AGVVRDLIFGLVKRAEVARALIERVERSGGRRGSPIELVHHLPEALEYLPESLEKSLKLGNGHLLERSELPSEATEVCETLAGFLRSGVELVGKLRDAGAGRGVDAELARQNLQVRAASCELRCLLRHRNGALCLVEVCLPS